MNNKIIKFVNGDLQLDVTVSPDNETVWLNRNQLSQNLRQFKDLYLNRIISIGNLCKQCARILSILLLMENI